MFSLPGGTEMVHFPPFASTELCVHSAMTGYCPAGLPHSETPRSKPVCGSPRLIAAYHVLHRLSAPRHPPCTLSSLTKLECISRLDEPVVNAQFQLSKIPATFGWTRKRLSHARLLRSWRPCSSPTSRPGERESDSLVIGSSSKARPKMLAKNRMPQDRSAGWWS